MMPEPPPPLDPQKQELLVKVIQSGRTESYLVVLCDQHGNKIFTEEEIKHGKEQYFEQLGKTYQGRLERTRIIIVAYIKRCLEYVLREYREAIDKDSDKKNRVHTLIRALVTILVTLEDRQYEHLQDSASISRSEPDGTKRVDPLDLYKNIRHLDGTRMLSDDYLDDEIGQTLLEARSWARMYELNGRVYRIWKFLENKCVEMSHVVKSISNQDVDELIDTQNFYNKILSAYHIMWAEYAKHPMMIQEIYS